MAIFTEILLVDTLGIVLALFLTLYAFCKWRYTYWRTRNVPYFEPNFFYGNLQNQYNKKTHYSQQIADLYLKAKKKGYRHLGVYFMMKAVYLPVDLELLKHIMTKDFQHFVDRGLYTNEKDDPISCHLFAIGGSKWRSLRTKLTPTFTSGKMKVMFQTLVDCGLVLEKYLVDWVDKGEAVDIKDVLGCFSTDIIGSCAFGLDCNSFKEPNSELRVYSKKLFKGPGKVKSFFRSIALQSHELARFLRLKQIPEEVSEFFYKLVKGTVQYRLDNNYVRNDFLQLLIDMLDKGGKSKGDGPDNTLTMDEITAQSFVFFIAGFETSSTTMTFALFELARHPEIQDKVREEIQTILAKHDNQITYDSLSELKYMGQVIDETLRKYPPLPCLTRTCTEDYKVPGENVVIEKGTRVLISVLGIHYDGDNYKDPEVFDPDRFSEENKKTRHPYSHIPFGEGPRICIGERFGIMQSKVGLTCILRNYRVKLSEKTELPLKMAVTGLITSTQGGIWLNLEKI